MTVMTNNPMAPALPAERLVGAATKCEQIEARRDAARLALEDLRQAIAKEKDSYIDASARS